MTFDFVNNKYDKPMPNGWKKNARYFNDIDMTHDEYIQKKQWFRTWKKEKRVIDSKLKLNYDDINPWIRYYDMTFTNNLTENEKSMFTFYISKQLVKQSNATFKKNSSWKWRKKIKTKKNYNKYSRNVNRNNKVYYSDHKKMKIKPKSNDVNIEEKKAICSICYEKKNIISLFAISCKNKGIGKFKKNVDKIICNDCMSKVNTCPYCRSHKLNCIPTKSKKRLKKQRKISKVEQIRKNKMQCIKKLVSEHSTLKHVQNQLYPDTILGYKRNKFKYFDSVKLLKESKYNPLPLKLYKYYKHWVRRERIIYPGRRGVQFIFNLTTYDKVSYDIIGMYSGYNNFDYDTESDSYQVSISDVESGTEYGTESGTESEYGTESDSDTEYEGVRV